MRISQTAEQIKALSVFQSHCEIDSVTLQASSAMRAKAGTAFKEPFSVKPALSNISSSLQGPHFIVEVSFEYAAWDSSEPPERLFLVNCTFEVAYRIRDEYVPTEEEKSSFAKGTGVFNCWPYAREFFRDITARLGHQTPVLPLLRISPKAPPSPPKASPLKDASSAVIDASISHADSPPTKQIPGGGDGHAKRHTRKAKKH